jgi:hypothetical protein
MACLACKPGGPGVAGRHRSALRGNAHRFAGGATEQNRRVWRKDEIGTAGRVYDSEHQLHFEIACDDDNLERLFGQRTGNLNNH